MSQRNPNLSLFSPSELGEPEVKEQPGTVQNETILRALIGIKGRVNNLAELAQAMREFNLDAINQTKSSVKLDSTAVPITLEAHSTALSLKDLLPRGLYEEVQGILVDAAAFNESVREKKQSDEFYIDPLLSKNLTELEELLKIAEDCQSIFHKLSTIYASSSVVKLRSFFQLATKQIQQIKEIKLQQLEAQKTSEELQSRTVLMEHVVRLHAFLNSFQSIEIAEKNNRKAVTQMSDASQLADEVAEIINQFHQKIPLRDESISFVLQWIPRVQKFTSFEPIAELKSKFDQIKGVLAEQKLIEARDNFSLNPQRPTTQPRPPEIKTMTPPIIENLPNVLEVRRKQIITDWYLAHLLKDLPLAPKADLLDREIKTNEYACNLLLMSFGEEDAISKDNIQAQIEHLNFNVDTKDILNKAKKMRTPILIKTGKVPNHIFYIYGDRNGNGEWGFTQLTLTPQELANLNQLNFENTAISQYSEVILSRDNFTKDLIDILTKGHMDDIYKNFDNQFELAKDQVDKEEIIKTIAADFRIDFKLAEEYILDPYKTVVTPLKTAIIQKFNILLRQRQGYNKDLLLRSCDDEKKISETIQLASPKETPILIRVNDKFYLYGMKGNEWKVTPIRLSSPEAYTLVANLPFDKETLSRHDARFNDLLVDNLKQGHEAPSPKTRKEEKALLKPIAKKMGVHFHVLEKYQIVRKLQQDLHHPALSAQDKLYAFQRTLQVERLGKDTTQTNAKKLATPHSKFGKATSVVSTMYKGKTTARGQQFLDLCGYKQEAPPPPKQTFARSETFIGRGGKS